MVTIRKKRILTDEEIAKDKEDERRQQETGQREKRARALIDSGQTAKQADVQAKGELRTAKETGKTTEALQQMDEELLQLQQKQSQELVNLGQEDLTKLTPEQQQLLTAEGKPANDVQQGFDEFGNPVSRPVNNPITSQDQKNSDIAGAVGVGALAVGIAAPTALPAIGATLGKMNILTAGLAGFSINSILSSFTSGRTTELEGDIGEITALSKAVKTDVAAGADPFQAIAELQKAEEEIRWKIGELNRAISINPKDRAAGKDTQEFARLNLETIVRRRQAIERYILTKDINQLTFGETPEVIQ